MASWRMPALGKWAIDCTILCEIKMEMYYKLNKIKHTYHACKEYEQNNITDTDEEDDEDDSGKGGKGDEGSSGTVDQEELEEAYTRFSQEHDLIPPDSFLCPELVKILTPDSAEEVFSQELELLNKKYLNAELNRLAQSLEMYLKMKGLAPELAHKLSLLSGERQMLQANINGVAELTLIAGFELLNKPDRSNPQLASVDEFIDRLLNGEFVKGIYHPLRIHYAVLMYKMRGLLTRGVALRSSDPSVITQYMDAIQPRISRILSELDTAAMRAQNNYRNRPKPGI